MIICAVCDKEIRDKSDIWECEYCKKLVCPECVSDISLLSDDSTMICKDCIKE
jgi:DNA-directed RNA polymerase subunit RPC12/RpoP